jgi:hypothetical protein
VGTLQYGRVCGHHPSQRRPKARNELLADRQSRPSVRPALPTYYLCTYLFGKRQDKAGRSRTIDDNRPGDALVGHIDLAPKPQSDRRQIDAFSRPRREGSKVERWVVGYSVDSRGRVRGNGRQSVVQEMRLASLSNQGRDTYSQSTASANSHTTSPCATKRLIGIGFGFHSRGRRCQSRHARPPSGCLTYF